MTKNFRIILSSVDQLNELNCLSIQFSKHNSNIQNQSLNNQPIIHVLWLNNKIESVDQYFSASSTIQKSIKTYSSYFSSNLKDLGLKSSTFTATNSIGIIGDFSKQSYFGIENFQLKNYDASKESIQYEFESYNPKVIEFDSYDKLNRLYNLEIIGQPQIVETR